MDIAARSGSISGIRSGETINKRAANPSNFDRHTVYQNLDRAHHQIWRVQSYQILDYGFQLVETEMTYLTVAPELEGWPPKVQSLPVSLPYVLGA